MSAEIDSRMHDGYIDRLNFMTAFNFLNLQPQDLTVSAVK